MKALGTLLLRALTLVGQLWTIIGISLLLLLLIDQGLRMLLPDPAQLASEQPGAVAPERTRADTVHGAEWIAAYWREHEASRYTEWHSYVYWRRRPFAGALVNVDAHGFRATPHAQPQHTRTIWLFGGSTVWGTGNRDDGTLAAQLEQVYLERAPELGVQVLNFGESGYVARQSLTAFQSALACQQPAADLAIFLDGANDGFAALQSGVAGLPQNEDNRRREFNSSRQLGAQLRAWAARLEGIARLAAPAPAQRDSESLQHLADAVVDNYLTQAQNAALLAPAHAIDVLYAWQPTVFDRTPPRADEAAIVAASPADHVQLQRLARAHLRARLGIDPSLPVIDLGGVFDAHAEPVFFDFVHLSEAGQRLLAERLFDLSRARVGARPPREHTIAACQDLPADRADD